MLLNQFRRWVLSVGSTSAKPRKVRSRNSQRAATVEILESRSLLSAVSTMAFANAAPVMTSGTVNMTISEDQTTNAGYLVRDLVQGRTTDSDPGALLGLAVTATTNGTGYWQYYLSGGTTWQDVGPVSNSSSLLLRDTDSIRFVPDGRDETTASITFRAWDQTSGNAGDKVSTAVNGGTTAFSVNQVTGNMKVTAMNDSPVINGANNFTSITPNDTNNAGQAVSTLIAGRITDVDPNSKQGIAIVNYIVGSGGWQYSIDNGGTWANVDNIWRSNALLLRPEDRLRYVPYGSESTNASLTFLAWDQTSGTAGTRFNAFAPGGGSRTYSLEEATSQLSVIKQNSAPELVSGSVNLSPISEDQTTNGGYLIRDIVLGRLTDRDAGALSGIALTRTTNGTGLWQYSTDGGTSWSNVGAVSDSSALLLRLDDLVRFVPDAKNGTSASLTFRGWDQTTGSTGAKVNTASNGGTTAFSTGVVTANLVVLDMNDAPVLNSANGFTSITEDQIVNPGNLISQLLAGKMTDVDRGALQGIALTALNSGNGKWQYSLNNGSSWIDIASVSTDSALLLRSADRLRFVPNGENATRASVTFRAWDQTSGTAGATANVTVAGGIRAFSSGQGASTIVVTAANDAPVLHGANSFRSVNEDQINNTGDPVSSLISGQISDVDTGAVRGIAVKGFAAGNGTWQYSLDGAATWTNLESLSAQSALLLRATDRVRFVPNGVNATTAILYFHAWDQTSGVAGTKVELSNRGGKNAFSLAQGTSTITVTAVNDAPVLAGANDFTAISRTANSNSGNIVTTLINGKVTDVDSGAVRGIAVFGLTGSNGKWQFSTNGGQDWNDVGAVSNGAALLLKTTDRLRFVPNGSAATTASVAFRAWDQSFGIAGLKTAIGLTGSTSPFSSATATSKIIVS